VGDGLEGTWRWCRIGWMGENEMLGFVRVPECVLV
jgi:hypothetical protein